MRGGGFDFVEELTGWFQFRLSNQQLGTLPEAFVVAASLDLVPETGGFFPQGAGTTHECFGQPFRQAEIISSKSSPGLLELARIALDDPTAHRLQGQNLAHQGHLHQDENDLHTADS